MKDDLSELRIAIGSVLSRWQIELAEARIAEPIDAARVALLESHVADLRRAITPRWVAAELDAAAE